MNEDFRDAIPAANREDTGHDLRYPEGNMG